MCQLERLAPTFQEEISEQVFDTLTAGDPLSALNQPRISLGPSRREEVR